MVWVVGIAIGLLLLFAFPKQMGVLVLLLVLGAVGIVATILVRDQWEAKARRKKEESIILVAAYDVAACSAEFPLLITLRNGYTETIQSLTFEVAGFREGYSSPVYLASFYKSDRIVKPGDNYTACWTQPPLDYGAQEVPPAGLKWRVTYRYATFGDTP